MKNILFLIAFFPIILFGQLRADQLPEITDPAGTDAFYSAERGSFQKITLTRLQTFLGATSGAPTTDTLTASAETSMRIKYTGTTAPALSKTSAGQYLLTVPAGTDITGFVWYESGATFTGGAVKLTIRDADGESLYGNYTILQSSTGDEVGQLSGIVVRQTTPLAGDVLVTFPNMSSISGDFIITGKPF
jgi:hypothetical protein